MTGYPSPKNPKEREKLYKTLGFDLQGSSSASSLTPEPLSKGQASSIGESTEEIGWAAALKLSGQAPVEGRGSTPEYFERFIAHLRSGEPTGVWKSKWANRTGAFTHIKPRNDPSSTEPSEMSSGPSREEIDAKLALVEARSENRFIELSGKLDRIADSISNLKGGIEKDIIELRTDIRDVKSDNKNTRWTIVITVIASVIAALGAIWTTQGSLLSAFQVRLGLPSSPSTVPGPTTTASPPTGPSNGAPAPPR